MCVLLFPPSNQLTDCHKFFGLHNGVAAVYVLLGDDATSLGNCFPTFLDNIVVSSSRVEMYKNNVVEHFNP
jgi:hypothetical protein